MPPRSTPAQDAHSVSEKLGEIRGQLRELIHNQNNHAMKQDAIGDKLAKLEGVPADLIEIKGRLTSLETDRNRRDGATGVVAALLKSPALGWLTGTALAAWAFLSGKGH